VKRVNLVKRKQQKQKRPKQRKPQRKRSDRLRFAVVGQGYFSQAAVLPAFGHARSCELVALFSDDQAKRDKLRRKHQVPFALPYEEYDDFLRSGEVQAVYIAVPNHLHRDYTVRAAKAGVHVLCEKPMAVTVEECEEMMEACAEARVKLMIAYRLHLEQANLAAIEAIRKGRLGDPRSFSSTFSFQLDEDNVRSLPTSEGGGPLYDIGTYCINAARYLLQAEPIHETALTGHRPDVPGLERIEEQAAAVLRFPEDRLASFTVGFGAADVAHYRVVGTRASLTLDPAYTHSAPIEMVLETERGKQRKKFPLSDQVAAELSYFAECVRTGRNPEPDGWEGLHDVAIIRAILESARTGLSVDLHLEDRRQRPGAHQTRKKPAPRGKPDLVNVAPPRE
jgi:glucose-fructose oxidoreductase